LGRVRARIRVRLGLGVETYTFHLHSMANILVSEGMGRIIGQELGQDLITPAPISTSSAALMSEYLQTFDSNYRYFLLPFDSNYRYDLLSFDSNVSSPCIGRAGGRSLVDLEFSERVNTTHIYA
jgi:hypothetical protein